MNVQEYISSGIVESYVLGLASPEERSEFESMCKQYPELLQARLDFEKALEKQATENAITPPADLKNKIFEQVGIPSLSLFPSPSSPAPVRQLYPRSGEWWKYVAAACILLLAGSLYWNISLQKENKKIKSDLNNSNDELARAKEDVKFLSMNPAVKMASMKGLDPSPHSFATVYWDTTTHDVYMLVNNLPKPASDKQYQMWALLDGKPIDMGMIDNEYFVKQDRLLIRAKNVQHAQAFAISLEKKGGSNKPAPDGPIYVLGNL